MSFSERWYNTIVNIYDWISRRLVYIPTENALAQKYFGHLGPLPSIDELHRNISLYLVNEHRALAPPKPSMPSILFLSFDLITTENSKILFFFFKGVISIGGAHIKPPKPLPKDLQIFLDESTYGVIYFSLGSVLKSAALPKKKIKAFLGEF